jgi:hypothetical protein
LGKLFLTAVLFKKEILENPVKSMLSKLVEKYLKKFKN